MWHFPDHGMALHGSHGGGGGDPCRAIPLCQGKMGGCHRQTDQASPELEKEPFVAFQFGNYLQNLMQAAT